MTNERLTSLLADCVERILEFEGEVAGDVLHGMGITPAELWELGYRFPTYSIDGVSVFGRKEALVYVEQTAAFKAAKTIFGFTPTEDLLLTCSRSMNCRFTYDGEFIACGYELDRLYGDK